MSERLEASLKYASNLKNKRTRAIRRKARRNGAVVYFIQAGEYVKVGITDRLKHRIYAIQNANPHKVVLLKVLRTENPVRDEKTFHRILKPFHERGEWFRIPEYHSIMLLLKS